MFIVSPIFLKYSASWKPKQRILQLMLCPSPSGPSWRWNVAVICPGRPQSCHAPTVEYAPLKMVAVPSWWSLRNDQEKRWCRIRYQLFPLAMCFIYRYISGAHQAMQQEVWLFGFFRIFRTLGSLHQPNQVWHETPRGHTHSGPDVGPINSMALIPQNKIWNFQTFPPKIFWVDLPGISYIYNNIW